MIIDDFMFVRYKKNTIMCCIILYDAYVPTQEEEIIDEFSPAFKARKANLKKLDIFTVIITNKFKF